MHFSTETVVHWQLTPEEDTAVRDAIREYLAMPQAGDAVTDRRCLVLGAIVGESNGHRPAIPAGYVAAPIHPHENLPLVVAEPDMLPMVSIAAQPASRPTEPPTIDYCPDLKCAVIESHIHDASGAVVITATPKPALTDEQRTQMQAASQQVQQWSGVKLATPEGKDR